MNSETKQCKSCNADFTIEPDDFAFYEMVHVPPPTWCPECRMKRRLHWQGYQHLYKNTCAMTGESVISTHHPDSPYKVYKQDIWWSDKWDPLQYGRDFDPTRPFLEQFQELMQEVPLPALYTEYTSMINSDYCNGAAECKNCYLCFRIDSGEDNAYLNMVSVVKNSYDCSYNRRDDTCYGNVITHTGFQTFFCEDVVGSHDMWFCRSAVGCHDRVATANISKQEYMMFGQQHTKEEYQAIFNKYDFGSARFLDEFKQKAHAYLKTQPYKHFNDRSSQDTTGEYVYNSKSVKDSYMVRKAEDCRYMQFIKSGPVKNSYDYTLFGGTAENIYESSWVGLQTADIKFSAWCYKNTDIEYCFGVHSSNHIFGSVGIRKGEYCILNKKYSKEEYLKIVAQIKEQMNEVPYVDKMGREYRYGEMLPTELCPWTYNETLISEWFPLEKKQAIEQGYSWRDADPRDYQEATMEIPDHIKDVKDDILKAILKCDGCGKNYRLIQKELDFYRRFNLPVPRHCPLCRDRARTRQLNPMTVYDRTCMKCNAPIKTSWPENSPEIVYCAKCYNEIVY